MSVGSPPVAEFVRGRSTGDRPFVPIVGTLAAEIDQIAPETFLSDPTRLANGLQRAGRLFDLDALCVVPAPTLLAEALGASVRWNDDRDRFETVDTVETADALADPGTVTERGRVPTVVEAADRLVASTGGDVGIFGVLPGPHTTAEALFGGVPDSDDRRIGTIRTATGDLARAFGRVGVDGFLVAEDPSEGPPSDGPMADVAVELLEVVDNIAEFFNAVLGLAPGGYTGETIQQVVDETAVDAVLLDTDDPTSAPYDDVRVGGGITASLLEADEDQVEATVEGLLADLPTEVFLASGVEIPRNVHPRKLQAVRRALETAPH